MMIILGSAAVKKSIGQCVTNVVALPFASLTTQSNCFLNQQHQHRSYYQAVLGKRLDLETGTWKYEDWDHVSRSLHDPKKISGKTLLRAYYDEPRHIKPTEMRRRLENQKQYKRKFKQMEDLANYVKFLQEYDK